MVSNRWINRRKPYWERLEKLAGHAQTGAAKMSGAELQELGLLYRQASADLATVTEDRAEINLAGYLNRLLVKGHNLLHVGRRPARNHIATFYLSEYPAVFRTALPLVATATLIFFLASVAGWAVAAHDPAFAHRFLGPHMMDAIARRKMWTDSVVSVQPQAASAIATNNITVTFMTFALGITGIGTLWMLVFNGLMLGVVGAATWQAGMAMALWSFVAPHGVLELPAIFIAGAAGLELARGLFFPGFLPRKESITVSGRRAVKLLVGTIPMLIIAGTVEGFFSPSSAPRALKFSLAAVLFAALLLYLFRSSRNIVETK
jgi:uncharacterized membrane protein SpoIIM required for sporulation